MCEEEEEDPMCATADIINGLFEVVGAFAGIANCVRLHKDKQVKGYAWQVAVFFLIWYWWFVFYYCTLNQVFSMVVGVVAAIIDTIWVLQFFYWSTRERPVSQMGHLFRRGVVL